MVNQDKIREWRALVSEAVEDVSLVAERGMLLPAAQRALDRAVDVLEAVEASLIKELE